MSPSFLCPPDCAVPDTCHARSPLGVVCSVLCARVHVAVGESHQPPHHGEEQPTAQEGHGEDDQRVTPFQVHQGGEDVLQESPLLTDVLVGQVACSVLGDEAGFARPVPDAWLAQVLGSDPCQHILLRDDTLPSQHLPATIVHLARCETGAAPRGVSPWGSLPPLRKEQIGQMRQRGATARSPAWVHPHQQPSHLTPPSSFTLQHPPHACPSSLCEPRVPAAKGHRGCYLLSRQKAGCRALPQTRPKVTRRTTGRVLGSPGDTQVCPQHGHSLTRILRAVKNQTAPLWTEAGSRRAFPAAQPPCRPPGSIAGSRAASWRQDRAERAFPLSPQPSFFSGMRRGGLAFIPSRVPRRLSELGGGTWGCRQPSGAGRDSGRPPWGSRLGPGR